MSSNYFFIGGASLALLLAGYTPTPPPLTSTPSPLTQTASATPSAAELKPALQQAIASYTKQQGTPPEASDRFFAQTMEGTVTQAVLKTYDDPVMAIATKYPSNMTVDANCSGEGCGFFFKFTPQKNALDDAEVHIFLPAGAKTTAQSEIGLDDLIKGNGWTVASQTASPREWKYPWVKKVITFSADQEMSGRILIGETNGQGVRVILLYPAEMSGSFTPAAKTILDNLKFKPDKLPILGAN